MNWMYQTKKLFLIFRCSPLATAGGILSTFKQCQKYQEKRDLDGFTSGLQHSWIDFFKELSLVLASNPLF